MPESSSTEATAEHRDSAAPRRGRTLVVISLVVAIAAMGLSGWLLVRLAQEGTPESPNYSGAQRADAKHKICTATALVRKGVSLNTNLQPPGGPEDITGFLARLDPATPPELSDAVKKFANLLMDIGAAATSGQQNSQPEQAARLKEADAANTTIAELCK
jgi:hypothetical protein